MDTSTPYKFSMRSRISPGNPSEDPIGTDLRAPDTAQSHKQRAHIHWN